MVPERYFLNPNDDSHIVLTHVEHKPLIIESSIILSTYWRHLDKALDESDAIYLIGYSGLDEHLNARIRLRTGKELYIVEWEGNGKKNERETFWTRELKGRRIKLIQLENILEYRDW